MKDKVLEILKSKEDLQIVNQSFSASCFNKTWDFIAKDSLSEEGVENMIATSYASLWHWKQRSDCKDENISVAYWLLGRVHCIANKANIAEEFGLKCLKISKGLDPFYTGYAYEVLLNSEIIKGNKAKAEKFYKLANEQMLLVEDKENQSYLSDDLEKLKSRMINL